MVPISSEPNIIGIGGHSKVYSISDIAIKTTQRLEYNGFNSDTMREISSLLTWKSVV